MLFGNRRGVVRVGRTAMIDIEKPITRLPEEVLDLLGLSLGERVIVEALGVTKERSTARSVSLRALPMRSRSSLLDARSTVGVPDFQQLVGDEDVPLISLDLAARERLGIVPGAPVYLRPAISGVLAREFSSMTLLFAAAVFSAAALERPAWAVGVAATYFVITIAALVTRLR